MTIRCSKLLFVLGIAAGGLLLGSPPQQASGQPEEDGWPGVGNCALHESPGFYGNGCCNHEPAVCDGFVITYSASCWRMCPIGKECKSVYEEEVLVYYAQDCSVDCSNPNPPWNSCVWDPNPIVNYGVEPQVCDCDETGPYGPNP
jgi:hypothetical protein